MSLARNMLLKEFHSSNATRSKETILARNGKDRKIEDAFDYLKSKTDTE